MCREAVHVQMLYYMVGLLCLGHPNTLYAIEECITEEDYKTFFASMAWSYAMLDWKLPFSLVEEKDKEVC